MPWEILYFGMEELTGGHGYVSPFNLSIGVQVEYATLWRDMEGRVYVAPAVVPVANCIPSDFPFEPSKDKPVVCKPIYFEELSPEIAEKLIQELSKKEEPLIKSQIEK